MHTMLIRSKFPGLLRSVVRAAGCLALLATSASYADELDLNLNDDAARLTYAWPISSRNLRLDAGWLHHQDKGNVIHAGMHLVGDASSANQPLIGGLGGKVFFIDPDGVDADATVLALGGFLRYTLPRYNRVNVYGHLYFAPDVLAFGDGDRYTDIEARIGYNVLRDADIYIGMRYSNIEFDPVGDVTMDNGLHAGIQLRF
ncbi:MAG: YfaZ family outer membrane protein [Pseudomonadota bacterium]